MEAKYPESQQKLMEHIGETLLCLQSAEACISFCLEWVFPPLNLTQFDELYKLNEQERKITLGQMIVELKRRVHIHPDFESLLERFVKNRNRFVHNIFSDSNYIINSSENITRGHEFLTQLMQDIWKVENIFGSYFQIWSKTIELEEFIRQRNPAVMDNEDVKSIRQGFEYLLHSKRWGNPPVWPQMRK